MMGPGIFTIAVFGGRRCLEIMRKQIFITYLLGPIVFL